MNLPSYQTQFNKITEAYIRGEIKPLDAKFCFCGTLCNNSNEWFDFPRQFHFDYAGYTGNDFVRMEKALIDTIDDTIGYCSKKNDKYEEALFAGMSAALDVLKEIHIEHGEVIDEVPMFTKRELTTTNS